MRVITCYALCLFVVNCSIDACHSAEITSRPNVIFMLTDDLGYSDISCYGATKVTTPHIDQLAAEGVRFTDFLTGASTCSPSRAAFLTGAFLLLQLRKLAGCSSRRLETPSSSQQGATAVLG